MNCGVCGLSTPGDECGNPGCSTNQMSFECKICRTISSGSVCSNPGCSGWSQKLVRNQHQGLDWGELLYILDTVTVGYIRSAKEAPAIIHKGCRIISYPRGKNWLWLCSDKAGPSLNWLPAVIYLRPFGFGVRVEKRSDFDARVHFPEMIYQRTDLRYFEIGAIFRHMPFDHRAVAAELLERVRGNSIYSFGPQYDAFFDAMIVLIFGVESARNWSTCATSLMLLELIAHRCTYGSRGKVFDLAKAFHHAFKRWDEDTYYGGKHPMATHGTGSGNLVDRGKIIRAKGVGWEDAIAADPRHHMVIYRELNVLKSWLELTDTLADYSELSVADRILLLLRSYLH